MGGVEEKKGSKKVEFQGNRRACGRIAEFLGHNP